MFKRFNTADTTNKKFLCNSKSVCFVSWIMGLEGHAFRYAALFHELKIAEIEFIYMEPPMLRHKIILFLYNLKLIKIIFIFNICLLIILLYFFDKRPRV